MNEVLEGDCHAVVFDVNVYLDIAGLVGPPFTWAKFDALAVAHANDGLPHPTDARLDSLRAMAVSRSGRFAGAHTLEVWTSDHIDDLVFRKLTQPPSGETAEQSGFGWDDEDAYELQRHLIDDVVYDESKGASLGQILVPHGTPPLDYEDGCVFATALGCAPDEEVYYHRYLVTGDRQFRRDEQHLSSEVHILFPSEWVKLIRDNRRTVRRALGKMPPPSSI